jgi:hypothetical protein
MDLRHKLKVPFEFIIIIKVIIIKTIITIIIKFIIIVIMDYFNNNCLYYSFINFDFMDLRHILQVPFKFIIIVIAIIIIAVFIT